ncbi:helix-turn-helix transcriptional regulator [Phenylobacterium sp.]|uniref:helix-turn-helix transcriptional regulator n=1 Tax=Phenylobacterium sp. TaxID=1871053 RepID=UPI0011F9D57A|nr:helix-turn-helix transcriptional regulator [Phenylobacterium sp.]THD65934.1 MAG: LuxR family transcriptional regulator [Phenylobacterium sp.]
MSEDLLIDQAEMSALIDRIYACVLDRDRWAGVLETLCPLIGGCAASLNVHNLVTGAPELLVEHGTDPAASESYVETYGRINPLIDATLLYTPPGTVNAMYRVVDMEDFRRSRFYREWVAPQGWGDWLGSVLIRTTASLAMLNVARMERDGPYSDPDLALVRLLTPHFERATALGRVFDVGTAERAGLSALVGRIRAPAFMVDAAGRIAFANASGEQLLAQGSVFQDHGASLVAVDAAARRVLGEAFSEGRILPAMAVVGPPDDRRMLSVIPPSAESGGHGIVLITAREAELPLPGPLLVEAFGLTAAEIRVLVALFKRRTLAQIAGDLGVTQRTAKAHLQHLFEKTGTRRQADLLAEVLSLVPPISVF